MWQLLIGYVADIMLGDPYWLPHPVRFIGNFISMLEKMLIGKKPSSISNGMLDNMDRVQDDSKGQEQIFFKNKNLTPRYKKRAGIVLLILVASVSYIIPFLILKAATIISYKLAIILEAIMIYQMLATKCLAVEAYKVKNHLMDNDIASARTAVSYLVSRDTNIMDETDIVKATVETISENTIDGIVAPIFFILIGGAPLGWAYKAVNTLDSMVGYKNDRYMDFGWASAKFDDVLNYIPARITACLMLISTVILGLDLQNAWKIFVRDRKNHASPNSPMAESVCAGALRIQLGGRASYFGVVSEKPTMGDDIEKPDCTHISNSVAMMYVVSMLSILFSGIVFWWM